MLVNVLKASAASTYHTSDHDMRDLVVCADGQDIVSRLAL